MTVKGFREAARTPEIRRIDGKDGFILVFF
jgi:hypothetical protein